MKKMLLATAAILGLFTAVAPAQTGGGGGPRGMVWVADEGGDSLTVIDATTNKVVKTVTGIMGPHNVQVAPDGKTVWATSHDNEAVIIDTKSYKERGRIPVGKEPAHVVLTPDGTLAYVSNEEGGTVNAIDTATMKVVATIPVGKGPHGLRVSPNGKDVYVADSKDTKLSVINVATNKKVADIEVGRKPVQVGFSPDGKYVYYSLNGESAVGNVDVATRKVIGKVNVGRGPVQVFATPDNRYVLVANQGTEKDPDDTVSMIETATFTVVATVKTGKGSHGVAINSSGTFAYITNTFADTVSVIDIMKRDTVATVTVGKEPNGISVSSF